MLLSRNTIFLTSQNIIMIKIVTTTIVKNIIDVLFKTDDKKNQKKRLLLAVILVFMLLTFFALFEPLDQASGSNPNSEVTSYPVAFQEVEIEKDYLTEVLTSINDVEEALEKLNKDGEYNDLLKHIATLDTDVVLKKREAEKLLQRLENFKNLSAKDQEKLLIRVNEFLAEKITGLPALMIDFGIVENEEDAKDEIDRILEAGKELAVVSKKEIRERDEKIKALYEQIYALQAEKVADESDFKARYEAFDLSTRQKDSLISHLQKQVSDLRHELETINQPPTELTPKGKGDLELPPDVEEKLPVNARDLKIVNMSFGDNLGKLQAEDFKKIRNWMCPLSAWHYVQI